MLIDFRIPNIVVDAVQYPAKLALVDIQGVIQTTALIGEADFMGMGRRHRGHENWNRRCRLHQIDGTVIEIVAQAVVIEIVRDIGQAGRPQRVFAGHALMLKVVDGVAPAAGSSRHGRIARTIAPVSNPSASRGNG